MSEFMAHQWNRSGTERHARTACINSNVNRMAASHLRIQKTICFYFASVPIGSPWPAIENVVQRKYHLYDSVKLLASANIVVFLLYWASVHCNVYLKTIRLNSMVG